MKAGNDIMSIKTELNTLKNEDIYSLMLFTLYQCRNTNEYSSLSELAYILDEKNLLSLCEYYGGTTITIPKIEDLELLLCGISVFKAVHLDHMDMEDSLEKYKNSKFSLEDIKMTYLKVSETMSSFKFGGQDER